MIYALIILTYLFGSLGTIFAFLFAVTLIKGKRRKYLIVATVCFFAITCVLNIGKEILSAKSLAEIVQGPGGKLTQKATAEGLRKELEEATTEFVHKAEDYFRAAERDFAGRFYRDAARNYQKSIDIVPTMSSYLNLGIAFLYVSDYKQAEDAFLSGIQIARKKVDKEFEALFLSNIGHVYNDQGNLQGALKSFQEALEIFRQIKSMLGQANAINNIGIVYFGQRKLEEALRYHQEALKLHKQLNSILGQAGDLSRIGIVYANQGKLDQALKFHQEALRLHKKIDNILGQTNAFHNIGNVYLRQGNFEEALASYQEALRLNKQIDNLLGQANALNNIGLVNFSQGRQAAIEFKGQIEQPLGSFDGSLNYFSREELLEALEAGEFSKKKFQQALEFHLSALEIFKQIGHLPGQADALGNIGNAYFIGSIFLGKEKMGKALESYKEALKIYKQVGSPLSKTVEQTIKEVKAAMDEFKQIAK